MLASATPMLAEAVVFPTPPLPEVITITRPLICLPVWLGLCDYDAFFLVEGMLFDIAFGNFDFAVDNASRFRTA